MIDRFLTEADTFAFACQQTGDCCRHYTIPCTPYDVVRLRASTGQTTTEMLAAGVYEIVDESFAAVFAGEAVAAVLAMFGVAPRDTFPIARLRKGADAGGPKCPFLTEEHLCGVYADRPGVCRSYPLGRVRTPDGPRWFERAYDCPGKGAGTQTVSGWIAESGLEAYGAANDRFAAFADALTAAGVSYADQPPSEREALRAILYDFDRVLDVAGCDAAEAVSRIDTAAQNWLAAAVRRR